MRSLIVIVSLLALAGGMSSVQAQESGKAASLEQLLRMVEQGRARDAKEFQQRETEFARDKNEQERLLREARARRSSEEARSEQLETTFEENETRTAELTETLNKRLGSLKELFGVLQQVAGDTRGVLENSLTAVQYPDRGEFLGSLANKMGTSTKLASIEEIERLWFELQREMTESGRVVRFPATVVTTDGEQVSRPVVRVGLFNMVSEGKYLSYTPETKALAELQRQPQQSRYIQTTSDIVNAQSGLVTFGLDPTRGQILALLVQAPDLVERIQQGGIVGYIIIALGILGLLIALERLVVLGIASQRVSAQLKSGTPNENNPLGRVLKVAEKHGGADRETLELKLGEAILSESPKLGRALLFLKIIAVVAPLLGLLGTVTGMIQTFQAITLFGTGDPKLMAGGISQALVTTVLGLTVAIPVVLLHTLVTGRSRRIMNVLQEQSAGIIAERSEQ